MYFRELVLTCLACLIGKIQTASVVEDECTDDFVKSLKDANFGLPLVNGTLGVTLNVKYLSKEGEIRKATIKLSDHCPTPKIICEGEKIEVNGELREGPLLHCSWQWKPGDSMWNKVEIGLTEDIGKMRAVSVTGRLSKEESDVFPEAANNGPLDFKIITANGSGVLRRKRRSKSHRNTNLDRKRKKKARVVRPWNI